MERSFGRPTEKSANYIAAAGRRISGLSPQEIAARIREVVNAHDHWRAAESISLNAAENVTSATTRRLLMSDLATRVTEGFPGDKDFPADRQNRFTDEIEACVINQLREMFGAKYVEWRPLSTSMANATVFSALCRPGDCILAQPESAGGNYSYNVNGPPKALNLDVRPLPFLEDSFEVDSNAAADEILAVRPKLVVLGGSNILFPYPLAGLRAAADEVGATILYDAAHVALYIAYGLFQNPLKEGADILTFSSHKIMSGPVGGVILTDDDELAASILPYSFPTFVQTRDQNKFAAFAHTLAEMREFGQQYAEATLKNATALGDALLSEGFSVLCSNRGFTRTHQIFVFISDEEAIGFEDRCQQANLLVTRAQRMGSRNLPAIRLTTQEITRRGMGPAAMVQIARWLCRVIKHNEDPEIIAAEIREFVRDYPAIQFSFDGVGDQAHQPVASDTGP